MKYCEKCGNKMSDDALFCSKCGRKVSFPDIHENNTIFPDDTPAASSSYSGNDVKPLIIAPVINGLCKRIRAKALFEMIGGIPFFVIFIIMIMVLSGIFSNPSYLYIFLVGSFLPVFLVCSFVAAMSNFFSAFKDFFYSKQILLYPVSIIEKYESEDDKTKLFGLITKTASNVCIKLIKEYIMLNRDILEKIEKYILSKGSQNGISDAEYSSDLEEAKQAFYAMPKENDMPGLKMIIKSFGEIL